MPPAAPHHGHTSTHRSHQHSSARRQPDIITCSQTNLQQFVRSVSVSKQRSCKCHKRQSSHCHCPVHPVAGTRSRAECRVSPSKRRSAHPQVQKQTGAVFLKVPFDCRSTCCHTGAFMPHKVVKQRNRVSPLCSASCFPRSGFQQEWWQAETHLGRVSFHVGNCPPPPPQC